MFWEHKLGKTMTVELELHIKGLAATLHQRVKNKEDQNRLLNNTSNSVNMF